MVAGSDELDNDQTEDGETSVTDYQDHHPALVHNSRLVADTGHWPLSDTMPHHCYLVVVRITTTGSNI